MSFTPVKLAMQQLGQRSAYDEAYRKDPQRLYLVSMIEKHWFSDASANRTADDFADTHVTSLPAERTRRARFRQWLNFEEGRNSAFDKTIEFDVKRWLAVNCLPQETLDVPAAAPVATPAVPAGPTKEELEYVQADLKKALKEVKKLKEENKELKERIAELTPFEEAYYKLQEEVRRDKMEIGRRARSVGLRALIFHSSRNIDDLADAIMKLVPGVPERSRRPRFRQWVESYAPSGWEPQIETAAEKVLAEEGLFVSVEEKPKAGKAVDVHLITPAQAAAAPAAGGAFPMISSDYSATKKMSEDMESMKKDLEYAKLRYFYSIALHLKLTSAPRSSVSIDALWAKASETKLHIDKYDDFIFLGLYGSK